MLPGSIIAISRARRRLYSAFSTRGGFNVGCRRAARLPALTLLFGAAEALSVLASDRRMLALTAVLVGFFDAPGFDGFGFAGFVFDAAVLACLDFTGLGFWDLGFPDLLSADLLSADLRWAGVVRATALVFFTSFAYSNSVRLTFTLARSG